ncbi:MAG: hypothetical protein JKY65_13845 [Planctomycetes bacterium]|nr:hypothetical protein [Planctomycetota bacterium]
MAHLLLERRWFGDIGFGLAFLLLLETLDHEEFSRDHERIRFLVLKIKRMAAVSWDATRKLSKTGRA